MRLIRCKNQDEMTLVNYPDDNTRPQYAILSHTWAADNSEEVTFAELMASDRWWKTGYDKIEFCAKRAREDGLEHFWVDTCCINKAKADELSEAILSMIRWYREAAKCYVYLSDVSTRQSNGQQREKHEWEPDFRTSRWFTRGWTLQELLAPSIVEFFSQEGDFLGTKETLALQIHEITTIPLEALQNKSLSQFSINERIRWSETRQTKRKEDRAYCLLGIFEVFMLPMYGEGEHALQRLRQKIDKNHGASVAGRLVEKEDTYSPTNRMSRSETQVSSSGQGTQQNINKGHGAMNNFATIMGNPVFYQGIISKERTKGSPGSPGSPQSLTFSEKEFLDSIGPRRYWHIQDRVEGTCAWTTESVPYKSWLSAAQSSVLWVTGAAGTGKTTLANFLVEQLEQRCSAHGTGHTDHVVCSFFCSRGVEGRHDVLSLLQDLILQLVRPRKKVIRVVKNMYGTRKQEYGLSLDKAWQIFGTVLNTLTCQSLFIAIDALDECDDDWKVQFLKRLANVIASVTRNSLTACKVFKIILSGQPQIRMSWRGTSEWVEHHQIDIEDRSTGISHDLDLFVEVRVSELVARNSYSAEVGRSLKDTLKSMAESSFLWLDIILKHIEQSLAYRLADLERLLANTPDDLYEAYARYLPAIPLKDQGTLQKYLQLLVACSSPLSLAEIDMLTLTDREDASLTSMSADANTSAIRATIQRALGPMVWFPRDTAQFCHSTARDFFLAISQQPQHILHRSHGVDLRTAHLLCAKLCLSYLLHPDIPTNLFSSEKLVSTPTNAASPISDHSQWDECDLLTNMYDIEDVAFLRDPDRVESETCVAISQQWIAYDYAAMNWTYHLKRTGLMLDMDLTTTALSMLSDENGRLSNWYRYQRQQSRLQMPPLDGVNAVILAAVFDLTVLLQVLLKEPSSRYSQASLSQALFWASSRGSQDAVELLLTSGASARAVKEYQVPLAVAAQAGHETVCNLLLKSNDVDPNEANSRGKTPLMVAAEANHFQILRSILQHETTRVNESDGDGRTALIAACRNGSLESVQILCSDDRTDLSIADNKGQTAFLHASQCGHLSVVSELLKMPNLDKTSVDLMERNAISLASEKGHLEVVKLLAKQKLNPASPDKSGRNSISWAANSLRAVADSDGKESVLQYLVRKAPHASDAQDSAGWTPLAWAMDAPGYAKAVEVLLRSPQVDINRRDGGGRCPLAWAAASGMPKIVECFLQRPDVDVNATSHDGTTALMSAAANGSMAVVRVLLRYSDTDVDRRDNRGRTAADISIHNKHVDIAELLQSYSRS